MASKLKLNKKKCSISIGALNTASTISKHVVSTTIQSCHTRYERTLSFLTVPRISENIPDQIINKDNIKIPNTMKLADPSFHQPAPVDILLGAGVTMSLFTQGQIDLSKSGGPDLFLQRTKFGWVIGGSAPTKVSSQQVSCHLASDMHFDFSKFWEIEEVKDVCHLTADELACEEHFLQHVTRNEVGRYIVALPFKQPVNQLGETRSIAIKRLNSLEKKLQTNPMLKIQYNTVLQEYLDLGHMSEVPDKQLQEDGFYLPHHAVIKEESQTTKVRVVFDGSAKGSKGHSLNELLHVGPTIQTDIFSLLLRFRLHQYVLTGDIEKMYRQFLVRPQDRKYQRILWRNTSGIIKTYELNTVTFGLAPSPFLAIRCLHKLADDEQENFSIASEILKRDLYVDDLLTGTQTLEEAIKLRDELIPLLQQGMLNIRKWASNEPRLSEGLPEANKNLQLQFNDSSAIKTLGVYWRSTTDTIVYTVKTITFDEITKRKIFSEIGKIFDPLGLLGPVVMTAKIVMQQLWSINIDWDEPVPSPIKDEWLTFYNQLQLLNDLSFKRHTILNDTTSIQLHGFCDASEKAYGACIYLRSIDKKDDTYLWSDSTIVLHWLRKEPSVMKTFVANRIAKIQEKTKTTQWCHVRTHDNPADLISRGQLPEEFIKTTTWQHGPSWLCEDPDGWPKFEMTEGCSLPELKVNTCLNTTTSSTQPQVNINNKNDYNILTRYSSWNKLQNVIAYSLRMKTNNKNTGGRLQNASIPYNQKYPIILPKNHHVTSLIIKHEHKIHLHTGTQATLYAVRQQYWPIDGRNQVSKIIRTCTTCLRAQPRTIDYLMGNLPKARVNEAIPFTIVGVDFCGPFLVKEKKERNRIKVKIYVAVFVCLVIKAVHLEMVSDLTTDCFIAALKRFVARRGYPTDIYSDNGLNFQGANNELIKLQDQLKSNDARDKLQEFFNTKKIQWHFTPPLSPHFGGLWEAAVKSFKHHFKRVIKPDILLSQEEFNTLIIEIEAILNSRPLTPISTDPNDFMVLSPGHFLIGLALTTIRDHDYNNIPMNRILILHICGDNQLLKAWIPVEWEKFYNDEIIDLIIHTAKVLIAPTCSLELEFQNHQFKIKEDDNELYFIEEK
ncbi:uncharacterized protein LOC122856373 [Aphidius gifuensis]|uniref:uncharacterized protein LOC122856373 n=1 Tax=Aphidius gifuensis TaxID=684658 RepID=UPI001CDC7594|nr:uncharacterized protein LOC122856373 [Aphidius gifuensis]